MGWGSTYNVKAIFLALIKRRGKGWGRNSILEGGGGRSSQITIIITAAAETASHSSKRQEARGGAQSCFSCSVMCALTAGVPATREKICSLAPMRLHWPSLEKHSRTEFAVAVFTIQLHPQLLLPAKWPRGISATAPRARCYLNKLGFMRSVFWDWLCFCKPSSSMQCPEGNFLCEPRPFPRDSHGNNYLLAFILFYRNFIV